jgi:hypothetical protein
MSENGSTGPRAEFFARIQRFADETLDNLHEVSRGKDADDKDARALRSVLLKLLRMWDKALSEAQLDPGLEEKLQRVESQASQLKSGEA